MIRINLFPKKEIKRKKPLKEIYFICLIITIIGIIASFGWLQFETKRLRNELKELEIKKKQYQLIAQKIKKINKNKKEATEKIKLIANLIEESPKMIQTIEKTVINIPRGRIYLLSYKYDQNTIIINGNALNLQALAEYVKNLEKSNNFKNITIKETKITTIKDYKLTNFTINISQR